MFGYDTQAGSLWVCLVDVRSPQGFEPATNLGSIEHLVDGRERTEVELCAAILFGLEKLHLNRCDLLSNFYLCSICDSCTYC